MEKRFSFILLLLIVGLFSCKKPTVYIPGAPNSRGIWFEPTPFGMAYIDRGSFRMGPKDEEIARNTPTRTVSIDAFWMDDTEITNNEYRSICLLGERLDSKKVIG